MTDSYRLKKLYASIGKLITSSLEQEEILEGIMEEVRVFFNPQNWSLMRLDPNTNELFFMIVQGIDTVAVNQIRLRPGEGVAGIVAQTGEPIFVPDTSQDSRFSEKVDRLSGFHTQSIIAVPMIFRGEIYGVIELINRMEGGVFSEDEYLILETIADFAAIAFANARIYQEARMMRNRDPLTGLYNRHMLREIMERWEKPDDFNRREEDPSHQVAAIMVDLDHFKDINDRFGHRDGDRVLKKVARLLVSSLRSTDLVFRIGGDEFLILIPAGHPDQLRALEDRIRKDLQRMVDLSMTDPLPVHFSYGVGLGPAHKIRDLIEEADREMYRQKGKDRVPGPSWKPW